MQKLAILDSTTERGIHNPRVVDLIRFDADTDIVRLIMIEFRPWADKGTAAQKQQLSDLEEKINNYADYIMDGHLFAQYPDYTGKRAAVELRCVAEPAGQIRELTDAAGRFFESCRIDFSVCTGIDSL